MIRKICLFLITMGCFTIAKAQWYNPDKVASKVNIVYNTAISNAQDGKWNMAKSLLMKAIGMDARLVDGYLSYAGISGENKQYDSAIIMFEKARSLDSVYTRDYTLPYSINLAGAGRFEEALAAVNTFLQGTKLSPRSLKAGEFRKKTYQFALDMKKAGKDVTGQFSPVNMGDNVNSRDLEYYPALPIEGNKLIYTRRVSGKDEDFFESDRQSNNWEKGKALTGDINTDQNEGAQCISQDGQWLIFTGCNRPGGYGSCDLYISYKLPNGSWSQAENLGPKINTEYWESAPTLSPDKKDLYFSSRRSDGAGAADIWVSHRTAAGKWTEPENLGPDVNTVGEESCPFVHSDNQTLYFTSDGLQGYGGSDLFVMRKGPNGKWSLPQNLGYPINTIENEGSLIVAADGQTAYYASDRSDTRGGLDLYTFAMPKTVQPVRTLWVRGKVYDSATSKGLLSSIELKDISNNLIVENVQTDETGNYLVTLPIGKNYSFTVNRKGYLFYSDTYNLGSNPSDSTYEKNIPLQPVGINTTLELKNILFETNAFKLQTSSYTELDKVVQLMKDNPTIKIQISGHTDNVGIAANNLKLSNSRAKSVVDYLVSKGITVTRLTYKGFGATKPIAENTTEAGRAKNRRTELTVTGM
jgi:outer membrane protein OmpA-like peptidoglycan-associated protein/tetratricopeptide (TPR) repeat protein